MKMKMLRLFTPLAVLLLMLPVSGLAVAASGKKPEVKENPAVKKPRHDNKANIAPIVSEASAAASQEGPAIAESKAGFSDDSANSGPAVIPNSLPLEHELVAEPIVTPTDSSLISQWLEERAIKEATLSDAISAKRSAPTPTMSDLEFAMGGGWCDACGCWMRHGLDPNGTPQQQIGHPFVCIGGISSQTCWSHQYEYCRSTG